MRQDTVVRLRRKDDVDAFEHCAGQGRVLSFRCKAKTAFSAKQWRGGRRAAADPNALRDSDCEGFHLQRRTPR